MQDLCKYIRDTPLECSYIPDRKFIWPAIIAGAAALGSTAINWFSSNKSNKSNEKINQRNIDYSREAFEKEKDYNNFLLGSQKQLQMSDAKAAGMNPAFFQASSLGNSSISPSVNMPQQLPMDYRFDTSGIAQASGNAMQWLLGKQDLRKKEAETDLLVAQKDRQLIENEILPNLLKADFDLKLSNIRVNGANVDLSRKTADKYSAEINSINKQMQVMDATVEQVKAQISVLNEEQKIKAAIATYQNEMCQAQVNQLKAQSRLSETQARDIMVTQVARLFNIKADTILKGTQSDLNRSTSTLQGAQYENVQQSTVESKARTSNIAEDTRKKNMETELVYWNVQQNQLEFSLNKEFARTERVMGLAKTTAETAKTAAEAAKTTVDIVKPWK